MVQYIQSLMARDVICKLNPLGDLIFHYFYGYWIWAYILHMDGVLSDVSQILDLLNPLRM